MAFSLTSTILSNGEAIPARFTCDGADVSPALDWSGAPTGTKTFTLIVDDPDAKGWAHWVLYDLPASATALPENVAKTDTLADLGGARQGMTDFRRVGYGGPCPPPGRPHHYHFKLYALDTALGLPAGAGKQDVERAMQGHILSIARLMGTYERRR